MRQNQTNKSDCNLFYTAYLTEREIYVIFSVRVVRFYIDKEKMFGQSSFSKLYSAKKNTDHNQLKKVRFK